MRVLTGTSGFSYAAWKGRFYPAGLPGGRMLAHYAQRLATVEVNATFRRVPKPEMLATWATAVGPGFVFSLKAPQRITHVSRLVGSASTLEALLRASAELHEHLGPVLFQLPPSFRADLPRLQAFLDELPGAARAAFEFRHESWFRDEVYRTLAARNAALCIADTEEGTTPVVATADFGYLRLRAPTYTDRQLDGWLGRIAAQPWRDALVYFKHEDEARGPELALRMRALAEEGAAAPGPAAP